MNYYIGIDSSTTATKALLMDAAGTVVGVASSEYGYETPQPLWSEQHPDLWWQGTCDSIRQVMAATAVSPQAIKKYPFEMTELPHLQREDGSFTNW